ncbi:MAG: hypothetical protein M3245_05610 [Actinomycetota bacterium]|nr:hypothetical protein [Actinomycetota bacterium]
MRTATAALTLALAILPGGAAGADPATEPSPTGCPSFFADGDLRPPPADPDVDVGPFGMANQRIQGFGLDLEDGVLTATIRVEDMKRQVMPGYRSTFWQVEATPVLEGDDGTVSTRGYFLMIATYDALFDRFEYRLDGNSSYIVDGPVTGEVFMGAGGGVRISAPLERLDLTDEWILGSVFAQSGAWTLVEGTGIGSVKTFRWTLEGPDHFPLLPCPGASFRAIPFSAGRSVHVRGWVLPQDPTDASLESLVDGSWQLVRSVAVTEEGRYDQLVTMPSGTHTIRMRIPTRALGDIVTESATVQIR